MDGPHNTILNWFGNIASVGAVIASAFGWIPALGALVAIVWYAIQIWESETVQTYLHARQWRKLVRLKRKMLELQERIAEAEELAQARRDKRTHAGDDETSLG
jgi:hypothetical protein